jgi:bifunctional non-homologous end joining protein LigD
MIDLRAQLATDVSVAEEVALINSDDWWVQPKYDGRRLIIRKSGEAVSVFNRNGEPTPPPHPAIIKALSGLPDDTVTDNEYLHHGPLVMLDLLQLGGLDARLAPYTTRHMMLESLWQLLHFAPIIQVAETAKTALQKLRLITRLQEEFAEGLIVRNKNAPYTAGRPGTGGALRRLKWKSRGEVIVQRRGDGTESFQCLAFTDDGQIVDVGAVNARVLDEHGKRFYEQLRAGEALPAEVEFLYVSGDGRLVQPRMIRFRTDVDPKTCLRSRLMQHVGGRFRKPLSRAEVSNHEDVKKKRA